MNLRELSMCVLLLATASVGDATAAPGREAGEMVVPTAPDQEAMFLSSPPYLGMSREEVRQVTPIPNRIVIELTAAGSRAGSLYVSNSRPLCLSAVEGCQAALVRQSDQIWEIQVSRRAAGRRQTIEIANSRNAADAVTPLLFKPERHDEFIKRRGTGPVQLLFLGDSITDWWPRNGKDTWAKFAPYHPADFGVAAIRTEGLLWNITHGELEGIQPKAVVILIGVNNLLQCPDEKPEWVAAGIQQVVRTVQEKIPQSQILLMGILPARNPATHTVRARITAVNRLIAKLADGKNVRFVDLGAGFLDADGNVRSDLTLDTVHPNAKGYQLWYDALQPFLSRIIGR